MEAQSLAAALLAMRVLAFVLLFATLLKQIKQIRTTTTEYPEVRIGVFLATLVLLIGQIIPMILDAVVAFGTVYAGRSITPNLLATSYSLNNAGKDIIIGILLAFQYYRPRQQS